MDGRVLLGIAVIACCWGASAEVALVSQGEAKGVIVVAAEATPTEQFAAQELQRYIAAATGATLEIVTDAPGGRPEGWGAPAEEADHGAAVSREKAREGAASLRLWSAVTDESSHRMTALQHDWVIVQALSQRLEVQPGDGIVLTAWVFVSGSFEQTKRGATLGLVGYGEDGKSPRHWTPGSI